jgi:hypothetical protein
MIHIRQFDTVPQSSATAHKNFCRKVLLKVNEIADTATYPVARRVRFVQRLLRILPILVTVALLVLLFRSSSGEKFLELWQQFDAGWMVTSASLFAISIAGGAVALLVLFELRGRPAWWARFTLDYLYVQALSQLTPAQAGEMALPYVAGRGRFAPGEIAASLVIQRMTTLAIVVLVALAGAGRWANPAMLWSTAALVLFFCLAGIAAIRNSTVRDCLNVSVTRRFGPILYGFCSPRTRGDPWISLT